MSVGNLTKCGGAVLQCPKRWGITRGRGNGWTYSHICVLSMPMFVLQVEPIDDSSGNDVPVIMSNSCDDISSGVDDIKQVNNFISYLTVLLLNLLLPT